MAHLPTEPARGGDPLHGHDRRWARRRRGPMELQLIGMALAGATRSIDSPGVYT